MFCSKAVQICATWWPKVWWNKRSYVSFQKVDCLARSVSSSRSIALLEDKETRHRSHALQTVAFESEARHGSMRHRSLLQNWRISGQVNSSQLGHTHGHYHWLAEGWMCLPQTLWCNTSLSCEVVKWSYTFKVWWEMLAWACWNFLKNTTVKTFWKSANVCRSYLNV